VIKETTEQTLKNTNELKVGHAKIVQGIEHIYNSMAHPNSSGSYQDGSHHQQTLAIAELMLLSLNQQLMERETSHRSALQDHHPDRSGESFLNWTKTIQLDPTTRIFKRQPRPKLYPLLTPDHFYTTLTITMMNPSNKCKII
jgi:hypothetical protein